MKRKIILGGLALAFVWIVAARLADLQKLEGVLRQGRWEWLLAAAGLQMGYYLVFTASYQAAFLAVDFRTRLRDLLPVTLAGLFVNVVAPAGGAGGMALWVDDAARRGHAPARAAAGVLLQLLVDFGAFLFLLALGLAYLFVRHDLALYQVLAGAALLGLVAGLAGLLGLGLARPAWLARLLAWVAQAGERAAACFHRPPPFAPGWPERTGQDLAAAASALAAHPERAARALGVAFLAHLVDLASLYTLFLAFSQPVSPGVLVAGYAIGVLFWIVSITPQGIGVVEGMMSLAFASLGVPAETAMAVALVFRGLTFWLPMVLGFLLLRRVKTFQAESQVLAESWTVRLAALLTGLMGLVNLVSSATPALAGRLRLLAPLSPLALRGGSRLSAALSGFFLLLLAEGLWRRKHTAWLLAVLVLVASAATHLLKGLDVEEAALAAGLGLWLGLQRGHFTARSDPPSIRRGALTVLAAGLFTLAYGATGFYLLDYHFQTNFSLGAALRQTLIMFTQFYDPGLQPVTGFGRYFAGSIYAVGWATFSYALVQLIRPVLVRHTASAGERARAAAIVAAYGHTSLARLTLLSDKLYYFSSEGALIAYVIKGRTALALGDPIGPLAGLAAAIREFGAFCLRNDWQPAFYQVLPDHLRLYRSQGFEALCIGQDAVVDLADFSLEGRANKDLRTSLNRMNRLGYFTRLYEPPVAPEVLAQLRLVSNEWLESVHGSEKKFSLGWFDEAYLQSCQIMVVESADGEILAFANLIPEYQANEISIDLMRHRRAVEPGTMDFLFVSLLQWAKTRGLAYFNLGLSPLAGLGDDPHDPALEKALHFTFDHLNRFYNFKGLHQFKEKFHPAWQPRYLVFPRLAALPSVSVALARADSGDDLLGYLRR